MKYSIRFYTHSHFDVDVEAVSEEQAIEKAWKKWNHFNKDEWCSNETVYNIEMIDVEKRFLTGEGTEGGSTPPTSTN